MTKVEMISSRALYQYLDVMIIKNTTIVKSHDHHGHNDRDHRDQGGNYTGG